MDGLREDQYLSPSGSAKMTLLLMEAGDNMIDRFALIKKAGRCGSN